MRVRFRKSDLLPAAAVVQSVANPQSTLPILSNVLLHTEHENVVSLSATDYETRVKIEVSAEVEKRGSATVPAKTFYDLVKELPEDQELLLDVKEKAAHLKCRDIRCELQTMPAKDFPKWPELDAKCSIELPQKQLKRLLEKVLFAVPLRDPRKVLLGALFEITSSGITAVATDGKILAYTRFAMSLDGIPKDSSIVIPHKLLEELMRNLSDEGTVTASFDDRQIAFQMNGVLFVSNQIEGKYPNFEAVVPKEFSREMRFQKPPVLSAIRRASILTDIKMSAITMVFGNDHVSVEAESYDKGRIREEVPAVAEGEEFKIVFNHKFVVDVLKAIDTEEVVLQVNHPTTPAVFRAPGEQDNFYLVMPIKLTEIREYDEQYDADREAEEEFASSSEDE